MLFNSYTYIFIFLPCVIIIFYYINIFLSARTSKLWLILASLFFYGYWNPKYLPLILISVSFNYGISAMLQDRNDTKNVRNIFLFSGIIFNLGLLGYFKYSDFFIYNINVIFKLDIKLLNIILPLAISFFTFQQISYLIDCYKIKNMATNFIDYCLYVTFFPQLIAGPIVLHSEMIPQFKIIGKGKFDYEKLSNGLFIFFIGLFKKAVIADSFSIWANIGFNSTTELNFFTAWATSLSYTLQLYFDFSGYTDMALGSAYMLNINLPINFNSPYKALNIQDFWRRWHITLGRFLRNYLYIPLGGNRNGTFNAIRNIFITFLLGGIWHGAGWGFVLWGGLHGAGFIIFRLWQNMNITLPKMVAWFITFNFVNICWIFFRAETIDTAIRILKEMFGAKGWDNFNPLLNPIKSSFLFDYGIEIFMLLICIVLVVFSKNSIEMKSQIKPSSFYAFFIAIVSVISLIFINTHSEFLYFQF